MNDPDYVDRKQKEYELWLNYHKKNEKEKEKEKIDEWVINIGEYIKWGIEFL